MTCLHGSRHMPVVANSRLGHFRGTLVRMHVPYHIVRVEQSFSHEQHKMSWYVRPAWVAKAQARCEHERQAKGDFDEGSCSGK